MKIIHFPDDRSLGYLHTPSADAGPSDFHGRFKRTGEYLEDTSNPEWQLIGAARGRVELPDDAWILLEVLADEARDLSPISLLSPDALDAIWLGNTYVNDDQLQHISQQASLKWLDVQNNGDITDRGIGHLCELTSLQHFGVHWTRISDQTLSMLAEKMPRLVYLDIWGCENISSAAIDAFKRARPMCTVRTE